MTRTTRIAAAVAVAALALAGCGDDTEDRPGNPAVYDRIGAATDCAALQDEFDIAMGNVERHPAGDSRRDAPLAYAKAADERMTEVGC